MLKLLIVWLPPLILFSSGLKAQNGFEQPLIEFHHYELKLTEQGSETIDFLGRYMVQNKEYFLKNFLEFTPINSQHEFEGDNCIGLKRYRFAVEYLVRMYNIDQRVFKYNDIKFTGGHLSGLSMRAVRM